MLKDLIESGYGNKEDYNCAEKILYGANLAYGLGLDNRALKLSAGFGGGMGIEGMCGALSAAVMVLSDLVVAERAHESTRVKELSKQLFAEYEAEMGDLICAPLKAKYRTEEKGCRDVILKAAETLDRLLIRKGILQLDKKIYSGD